MTKYSSSETTRNNIINATGILAAENGISNVTTREVAQASGENLGSIHYHFGGKEQLFEAVVQAAISAALETETLDAVNRLGDDPTPEELSRVLRVIVSSEISEVFRNDRPDWHSQVIYQLLQRDDELSVLFGSVILNPKMNLMARVLRLVQPDMSEMDIHIHTCLMKMPIFAHSNYQRALLKRLGKDRYSEEYLQSMEDLLVRQAQYLLGLPEDKKDV